MTTKKPSGRSHGFRHKSRAVMTKDAPRGISFLLREYKVGEQALIIIDPRQHKGLPHRRYHGKVGRVTEMGRRSVTLDVLLGNKTKTLITRLDHVKPFGVK
jgi:large subunit ribosomal protein L21e